MKPGRNVRTFKQKRAAATHQALLKAALRVFAKRGFDGAQTPEIAAVAGVSTGAFYRYFTDKRQAFLEMLADHLESGRARVEERLSPARFVGKGRRAAIDVVIDVLFEFMRHDAALHRVVGSMSMRDPEVAKLRAEFEAVGRESLAGLITAIIAPSVIPDSRATALILQIAAIEIAGERAGLRPSVGEPIPDAEVRRALGDMIERYLFPSPPMRSRARRASSAKA